MKVFATQTSEDPDIFNVQLALWKLARQDLWLAIGNPSTGQRKQYFSNKFLIEVLEDE